MELQNRANELTTETWTRVFQEAAQAGVLQADLTGGSLSHAPTSSNWSAPPHRRLVRKSHHVRYAARRSSPREN